MPALNTPQFSWVKSRLPKKPKPVPPIFQPEVAARAIVWAAEHPWRREIDVGFPTVKAIMAEKLIAGFADRYLAKKGYASQQTDEPEDPDRQDNLWIALPGDHGAHGTFDAVSRDASVQLWLTQHRSWLLGSSLLLLVVGTLRGRFRRHVEAKLNDNAASLSSREFFLLNRPFS
jgi:hypothetical protein